jgi:N6-L-threonylcarbamoyladenine synthase
MKVLGVESSCDETSVALLDDNRILSNVINSQINIHSKFGGVVPEIASREHIKNIPHVFEEAVRGYDLNDIDYIAVTNGPGLIGSLLVGLTFAKGLALKLNKRLVGVNHIRGHIYANFLAYPELMPPFLVLMVSGGHTEIVKMDKERKLSIVGRTLDDAAGEAFDKVARILGLGYPGGPIIQEVAKNGNPRAYDFPKPLLRD